MTTPDYIGASICLALIVGTFLVTLWIDNRRDQTEGD